jgi:hypothetical protein
MEMDGTLQYLDREELEKPKDKKILEVIIQLRAQKVLQLIEKLKDLTGADQVILRFKDKPDQ